MRLNRVAFYHVRTGNALNPNGNSPHPGPAPPGLDRASRRGRTVATAIFALVVSALTALWAGQILQQLVVHHSSTGPATECRPGVRALIDAVRRARQAAAEETGGEKPALGRFRATLAPAWRIRPDLTAACAGDPAAARALKEVDLLRYAEEHAVRYESAELARRRRRVLAIETTLLAPTVPAPSASAHGQWK